MLFIAKRIRANLFIPTNLKKYFFTINSDYIFSLFALEVSNTMCY